MTEKLNSPFITFPSLFVLPKIFHFFAIVSFPNENILRLIIFTANWFFSVGKKNYDTECGLFGQISRSWRSDLPKYFFLVFHLNFFQFLSFCCAGFLNAFLWYLNFAFSVVFEKAIDILWGLSFVWGLIDLFSDVCQSREWSSLRTNSIGNCLLHSKA